MSEQERELFPTVNKRTGNQIPLRELDDLQLAELVPDLERQYAQQVAQTLQAIVEQVRISQYIALAKYELERRAKSVVVASPQDVSRLIVP